MTRVLNCSETAFLCIFFSTINVYYTGVTCIDLFSEQANTKLKFCCFILDISLAEEKKVEIYCFRFASWLINFAWVTNYMPPYTYPPRVETLCIGIISVLIQVMCYSQMPLSIGTQLSFRHLFDKFLIRFETGQSDFQNKCEHVIRNIACLFVKFQSWRWTGVCKNAHKSVLVINKFFSCPNFGKI